jgi:hypothetical protein
MNFNCLIDTCAPQKNLQILIVGVNHSRSGESEQSTRRWDPQNRCVSIRRGKNMRESRMRHFSANE